MHKDEISFSSKYGNFCVSSWKEIFYLHESVKKVQLQTEMMTVRFLEAQENNSVNGQ